MTPQAWLTAVQYSLDEWEIERLTDRHGMRHLATRAIAILEDQRDHPQWWLRPTRNRCECLDTEFEPSREDDGTIRCLRCHSPVEF